jgi:hypothetical protein
MSVITRSSSARAVAGVDLSGERDFFRHAVDQKRKDAARGEPEPRTRRGRDEPRRGARQERAQIDGAARRGIRAKRTLGEGVDAEEPKRAARLFRRRRVPLDDRRGGFDAELAPETNVEMLVDAGWTADDMVRRVARHLLGRKLECVPRALVRGVDGDDHGHADGDAEDRKRREEGVPRQVAHARPKDERTHHTPFFARS